jgi:phage terminase small subunit
MKGECTTNTMETKIPEVSRDKILQELALIGFARVPDYLEIRDGNLTIRDLENLDGAAIASVEKGTGGLKMKFYDKLKALELMGKYLGMFSTTENKEETTPCNLLECILDATRGEVDLHDIPEIQQTADAGNKLVEPTGASGL